MNIILLTKSREVQYSFLLFTTCWYLPRNTEEAHHTNSDQNIILLSSPPPFLQSWPSSSHCLLLVKTRNIFLFVYHVVVSVSRWESMFIMVSAGQWSECWVWAGIMVTLSPHQSSVSAHHIAPETVLTTGHQYTTGLRSAHSSVHWPQLIT